MPDERAYEQLLRLLTTEREEGGPSFRRPPSPTRQAAQLMFGAKRPVPTGKHTGWFWFTSGKLHKRIYMNKWILSGLIKHGLALGEPDKHSTAKFISEAAQRCLDIVKEDIRSGNLPIERDLSPNTVAKRRAGGFTPDRPFFESGQLVEALQVERAVELRRLPTVRSAGVTGFGMAASVSVADIKHRPNYPRGTDVDMVWLFNTITRDGALIDISDPEKARKVALFFKMVTGENIQPSVENAAKKAGGARYIFIPPRPLFQQAYLDAVAKRVLNEFVAPRVENITKAFGRTLQYAPTTYGEALQAALAKRRALEGG